MEGNETVQAESGTGSVDSNINVTESQETSVEAPSETQETTQETAETTQDDTATVSEQQVANPANIEKALKDTKAAFTKKAQENAELRKQLEAAKQVVSPEMEGIFRRLNDLKTRLATDYGDDYEGTQIASILGEVLPALTGAVSQFREAATLHSFAAELGAAHPDADRVLASPEFNQWLENKSPVIKAALLSDDPADLNDVLSFYKETQRDSKKAQLQDAIRQTAEKKMAATQMPGGVKSQPTVKPTFTRQQIDKMSPAEFARNEKAIDEAMRAGRVR